MPRRRRRAPVDPLALWSLSHLNQEADVRAGRSLGIERRAINAERERAARQAAANQLAIRGVGDAAAGMLRDAAVNSDKPYKDAANSLGGVAGGYLQGMEGRLQGTADPMHAVDVGGQVNVMRALGAGIPNEHLLTLGAQAHTYADQQPGISMKGTQEELASALKQSGLVDADYGQKLIDLAAKYPEVRQQIFDALAKFENEKRAQRLYERQFGLKQQEFAADTAYKQGSLAIQIQKLRQQGEQPDASLSKAYGYIVDGNGQPILDQGGNQIPVAKTASQKTGGAGGTYQKAVKEARTLRGAPIKDVDDIGEGIYLLRPGQKGYPDGTTNDPKRARHENDMSFVEALQYLMDSYGLNRKQARRALIHAGWKPDGKRPVAKKRGR